MFTKKIIRFVASVMLILCMALAMAACAAPAVNLVSISAKSEITLMASESILLAPKYTFDQNLDNEKLEETMQQLTISFSSSNEKVATVSTSGEVKALSEGESIITITADEVTFKTKITVLPILKGLETTEKIELIEGETFEINVVAQPATAILEKVVFTSKDEAVATVNSNGKVTAAAYGKTEITVSCGDISKQIPVIVSQYLESITLEEGEGILTVGHTHELVPVIAPEGAEVNLIWTSSDETVATVEQGNITALAEGETIIRVSIEQDVRLYAEYSLTVKAAPKANRNINASNKNTAETAPSTNNGESAVPAPAPAPTPDSGEHPPDGSKCTWFLVRVDESCYEDRFELYHCTGNCGTAFFKYVETRLPCSYTRQGELLVDGEVVLTDQWYCNMCGDLAP